MNNNKTDNNFNRMVNYIQKIIIFDKNTIKRYIIKYLEDYLINIDENEDIDEVSNEILRKLEDEIKDKYKKFEIIFTIEILKIEKNFHVGSVYFFERPKLSKIENELDEFYHLGKIFAKTTIYATEKSAFFKNKNTVSIYFVNFLNILRIII